eukprot:gene2191-487_t
MADYCLFVVLDLLQAQLDLMSMEKEDAELAALRQQVEQMKHDQEQERLRAQ